MRIVFLILTILYFLLSLVHGWSSDKNYSSGNPTDGFTDLLNAILFFACAVGWAKIFENERHRD